MKIIPVNYQNIGGRNQQCPMINTIDNGKLKLNRMTKLRSVSRKKSQFIVTNIRFKTKKLDSQFIEITQ